MTPATNPKVPDNPPLASNADVKTYAHASTCNVLCGQSAPDLPVMPGTPIVKPADAGYANAINIEAFRAALRQTRSRSREIVNCLAVKCTSFQILTIEELRAELEAKKMSKSNLPDTDFTEVLNALPGGAGND